MSDLNRRDFPEKKLRTRCNVLKLQIPKFRPIDGSNQTVRTVRSKQLEELELFLENKIYRLEHGDRCIFAREAESHVLERKLSLGK